MNTIQTKRKVTETQSKLSQAIQKQVIPNGKNLNKVYSSVTRIAELEAELKKEESKLAVFNKLPEDQRLATLLHDVQCHAAHEDQCGWYYESFEDTPHKYSTRQEYLKKARKLLTVASYSDLEKIVVIMNESFY